MINWFALGCAAGLGSAVGKAAGEILGNVLTAGDSRSPNMPTGTAGLSYFPPYTQESALDKKHNERLRRRVECWNRLTAAERADWIRNVSVFTPTPEEWAAYRHGKAPKR